MSGKIYKLLLMIAVTLALVLLGLWFWSGQGNNRAFAQYKALQREREYEMDSFIAYSFDATEFNKFLSDPTIKTLYDKSEEQKIYQKMPNAEGYISVEYFELGEVQTGVQESGRWRVGNWPIYTEFIDYVNNYGNFHIALQERAIDEEILGVFVISHPSLAQRNNTAAYLPPGTGPVMCIWIHTNASDYFLEHKPDLENPHRTEFTYDFYDLQRYARRYGG